MLHLNYDGMLSIDSGWGPDCKKNPSMYLNTEFGNLYIYTSYFA